MLSEKYRERTNTNEIIGGGLNGETSHGRVSVEAYFGISKPWTWFTRRTPLREADSSLVGPLPRVQVRKNTISASPKYMMMSRKCKLGLDVAYENSLILHHP